MSTRRLIGAAIVAIVLVAASPRAFAQDGPRTHSKEMLTDTEIISLTHISFSGNVNPIDRSFTRLPGVDADFDVDFNLLGYSRSFSLLGRTAVGSVFATFGDVDVEIDGPLSVGDSATGFGDPLIQLDVNLVGAPAMPKMPDLLRYDPWWKLDVVLDVGVPIGEYDGESVANIGQNRWYGRIGVPIMFNLGDWVPGRKVTLELMPAVYVFEDNDDVFGDTLENDPLFQLEAHLTRDFTESLWGSLDAVWYAGGKPEVGGFSGDDLDDVAVGFTLGYAINDNLMLTAGYSATLGDGRDDLDVGVFSISLVYGWHELLEGIDRLTR